MQIQLIAAALRDNGVRTIAALSLAGLTAALAWFNVSAWAAEGLFVLALLAGFFEALGFVFAVLVEDAVRARRFDRALVSLVILVGCAAFNAAGGHRAWEAAMADRQDDARQVAQAGLDRHRAELLDAAARASAEIAAVPLPDPHAMSARQAQARASWELATAEARARQRRAENDLAALPVVAAVEPEFDDVTTWGFLGFLEIAKALGLWAIGVNVAAGRRRPSAVGDKAWDASEAARRLVALRKDRLAAAA